MPTLTLLKCVCDRCQKEEVFESWEKAGESKWRQFTLGAPYSGRTDQNGVLCGDCVGDTFFNKPQS